MMQARSLSAVTIKRIRILSKLNLKTACHSIAIITMSTTIIIDDCEMENKFIA